MCMPAILHAFNSYQEETIRNLVGRSSRGVTETLDGLGIRTSLTALVEQAGGRGGHENRIRLEGAARLRDILADPGL